MQKMRPSISECISLYKSLPTVVCLIPARDRKWMVLFIQYKALPNEASGSTSFGAHLWWESGCYRVNGWLMFPVFLSQWLMWEQLILAIIKWSGIYWLFSSLMIKLGWLFVTNTLSLVQRYSHPSRNDYKIKILSKQIPLSGRSAT